jgi:hypothetical protein
VKIDRGIWAAMGAAVLFGLSTPLAKFLLADISPLLLAGLLYTGSGLGLALLLGVRALTVGRASISLPRGASLWWLLGAAFFGGALGPYLLMRGLLEIDSASASLTLNLEGVFTGTVIGTGTRRQSTSTPTPTISIIGIHMVLIGTVRSLTPTFIRTSRSNMRMPISRMCITGTNTLRAGSLAQPHCKHRFHMPGACPVRAPKQTAQ